MKTTELLTVYKTSKLTKINVGTNSTTFDWTYQENNNLTSDEAFEQIGKGTEIESGKQTELLILLQYLDSRKVFWFALDFLGKGCNK